MSTVLITPARSARADAHSIGSTLPFVLKVLTTVSRVTFTNGTSGGAAFFEIAHAITMAMDASTRVSSVRPRVTLFPSRNNRTRAATQLIEWRLLLVRTVSPSALAHSHKSQ